MSAFNPTGIGGPGPPLIPTPTGFSYADKAKMNVRYDQRLKRNVLNIEVEKKDAKDEMFLYLMNLKTSCCVPMSN